MEITIIVLLVLILLTLYGISNRLGNIFNMVCNIYTDKKE